KVLNMSGSTARYVRLTPASSFAQSLITLPPLATGLTSGLLQARITNVVPGAGFSFVIQLLDQNMNVLCDENRGLDMFACPGTPGYCCIPYVGCTFGLTAVSCGQTSGGTFSLSSSICAGCRVGNYWGPEGGQVVLDPIG